METVQLYSILNDVTAQAIGTQSIQAVDTASFIAMGDSILNSGNNLEPWLSTLVQRIGRTIISFRAYQSQLQDLAYTDMEWGAIMQKIKVAMPTAIADVSVELTDGESIDHYIVAKPKAKQKLFVIRSPYTFMVTIQRRWLKEAFLSESAMESFIGAIFGELQNAMAVGQESLGRMCMANFIANTATSQRINLLTDFNMKYGQSITADGALYNADFLRYAIGQMKYYSLRLTEMSTLYNKEGETRHTPIADQRFAIRSDFLVNMETQVEYAAFHDEYLDIGSHLRINFWQNAETPNDIIVTDSEGKNVEVENILGFIHDSNALGTYRKETDVLTTPVNARGAYYNTFYHVNDNRFNDMSENGLVFLVA